MEKRTGYFFKKFRWVLMSLLGVLGFASCDSIIIKCEYGTPYSEFKVSGKVMTEDNKPIEGIKTTVFSGSNQGGNLYWDTYDGHSDFSDKKGSYQVDLTAYNFNSDSLKIKIIYEDVDGTEGGGAFAKDSVIINSKDFIQTEKASKNWFQGAFSVSYDIKMKKSE